MSRGADGAPADDELERGLADLSECVSSGGLPTRQQARTVLVALGGAIRRRSPWASGALERLRLAVAPQRKAWDAAVRSELELACGEHCLSANPRYLGRPDYDFSYVCAARERLEDRLAAARALGIDLPIELERAVASADELIRLYRN
jgi:hypothetical protein